ncbi:MAG: HEPN domain-containing protein [Deltaproteobacteria bacterium]|nr:HEPN domain-containing protein [Deltaproteobacteria bacterium]
MNAINRVENAKLEKAKGVSTWEEAEILFERGKFDGAVSRAYYAAFHYACACLLTKGLEARSHQAVRRLFQLHFIRTGLFPEMSGVLLSHAQKAREEADYFPEVSFSAAVTKERLAEVRQFLATASKYLTEVGI